MCTYVDTFLGSPEGTKDESGDVSEEYIAACA